MPGVGEELFDSGVNTGATVPALWLPEWLNAFDSGGALYPDIKEDRDVGPSILAAPKAFVTERHTDQKADDGYLRRR